MNKKDMMEVHKMMNGIKRVNQIFLFSFSHSTGAKGHSMRLKGNKFISDKRKRFRTQYTVLL